MHKVYIFLLFTLSVHAQPRAYKVSNAHSHNDYEQRIPFWMAYDAGFGSIEADIYLMSNGSLQVAHDSSELKRNMLLAEAYLKPLLSCIKKNNGYPFPDTSKKLQMLIDVKSYSVSTLNALIALLKRYPSLIHAKSVAWVITGNRPDQSLFRSYPAFIKFDGELYREYSKNALAKINMFSDDFVRYSQWSGKGDLPPKDDSILKAAVKKAHRLHKPVRFWDAPDNDNAWYRLIQLRVDYINTDHIKLLADFLDKKRNNPDANPNTSQP